MSFTIKLSLIIICSLIEGYRRRLRIVARLRLFATNCLLSTAYGLVDHFLQFGSSGLLIANEPL